MNITKKTLLRSDINSRTKHLLNTLASFCNKHQNKIGWYTQSIIAECMSTSTRTVQRALKDALDIGLVSVRRRWKKCNEYTVNCLVKPTFYDDTLSQERTTSFKKYNDRNPNALYHPECPTAQNNIVREIESVVGTSKDRACWSLMARKCSPDVIYAGLSALRIAMGEKVVHRPAAYLVATVKGFYPDLFRKNGSKQERDNRPDSPTQKPAEPLKPLTAEQWSVNMSGLKMIMSQLRC